MDWLLFVIELITNIACPPVQQSSLVYHAHFKLGPMFSPGFFAFCIKYKFPRNWYVAGTVAVQPNYKSGSIIIILDTEQPPPPSSKFFSSSLNLSFNLGQEQFSFCVSNSFDTRLACLHDISYLESLPSRTQPMAIIILNDFIFSSKIDFTNISPFFPREVKIVENLSTAEFHGEKLN